MNVETLGFFVFDIHINHYAIRPSIQRNDFHKTVSGRNQGVLFRTFSLRSPLHCRRHSRCALTFPRAKFQCSHRAVLALFCMICCLHPIDVRFLQAIWPPEWYLQLPSFFAFYVSRGRAGRSNPFIRTLCFHFAITWSLPSTCHMQGDWYCLTFRKIMLSIQVICCQTSTMLWYDTSYRRKFVQSSESMTSPLHILAWVYLLVSKPPSASLHVLALHFQPPLFVLHPLSHYSIRKFVKTIINFFLPRGAIFPKVKTARFVRSHHCLPTFGSENRFIHPSPHCCIPLLLYCCLPKFGWCQPGRTSG